METHKIDSIFKKAINDSENFYDEEAEIAKSSIWNKVHKQKQAKPLYIRLLAAACILLFIGTSLIAIWNIKARNTIKHLVAINKTLKQEVDINSKNAFLKKEENVSSNPGSIDTIYIKKNVIIYKPLITIKQNTDTVYIKQIVFVEKEQSPRPLTANNQGNLSDSVFHPLENNYKTEIIISNNETLKKEKKIKFKFGGNNDQTNASPFALITKL